MTSRVLLFSLALNVLALSGLIFFLSSDSDSQKIASSDEFYDELCPTVIYNQNESVQTSFTDNGLTKKGKRKFDNCINPNTQNKKLWLLYIKKCLPLFKEYKPRVKKANRKLMTTVPSYVPAFNESSSVVDYPYENVTWKGLYKTPLWRVNLLNKLKFYSRRSGKYLLIDDDLKNNLSKNIFLFFFSKKY